MQQRVNVLASPEEALIINKQVESEAMIDAITAINDRTEAICDLLIQGIQHNIMTSNLLCSVIWQLQANMDCLVLFVNHAIKKRQLSISLITVARSKATGIIMAYGIADLTVKTFDKTVDDILIIKKYIKAVSTIAIYQESQVFI